MATRLSKAEGFSGLWKELIIRSNYTFYNTTLEKVKRADKVLSRQLRKEYAKFFQSVARNFVARYSGQRSGPTPQPGWPVWAKLSPSWLDKKASTPDTTNQFYSGLTDAGELVQQSDRGYKHEKTRESFRDFLMNMQEIDVEEFLGPLVIEYSFRTKGKKFVTQDLQNMQDLGTKVGSSNSEAFPSDLMITAEVRAFQNLRGVKMDEWSIVDKLIKAETSTYEQWRKINGTSFGRNGRPIRPLIGPSITKFMNEVSLKSLQQFNASLR